MDASTIRVINSLFGGEEQSTSVTEKPREQSVTEKPREQSITEKLITEKLITEKPREQSITEKPREQPTMNNVAIPKSITNCRTFAQFVRNFMIDHTYPTFLNHQTLIYRQIYHLDNARFSVRQCIEEFEETFPNGELSFNWWRETHVPDSPFRRKLYFNIAANQIRLIWDYVGIFDYFADGIEQKKRRLREYDENQDKLALANPYYNHYNIKDVV